MCIRDRFWLGFNDNASEGNWVWSSGEASTYTNWNSGEPNNSAAGSGEDCGQIYSNVAPHALGYWNDFICTEGLSYVCEMR